MRALLSVAAWVDHLAAQKAAMWVEPSGSIVAVLTVDRKEQPKDHSKAGQKALQWVDWMGDNWAVQWVCCSVALTAARKDDQRVGWWDDQRTA